ncbi:MAG: flagellar export chaperone FliS [Gemmatimonadales bacterium]|nr:flagellar export chaperone FliS [Gemmatimonadales bacterium]
MHHAARDRYLSTEVATMSPAQTIVALYRRIATLGNQALVAFERGDVAYRTDRLDRAQQVLWALTEMLDAEQGGEIAANLDALYAFCRAELLAAQVRREPQRIRTVLATLAPLAEAWEQVAQPAVAVSAA